MNVATITMPKKEAYDAYREYREAVRANPDNQEDRIAMMGYRAIARGQAVIDVAAAIGAAGLDEQRRPKLALARANWEWCWLREHGRLFTFQYDSWAPGRETRRRISFPTTIFGENVTTTDRHRAQVPAIPPRVRPSGDLINYFILWEADWQAPPVDPYLLRHLGGYLYVVLAAWNLTDLERAVMRHRVAGR
jgi:hypothetical protein